MQFQKFYLARYVRSLTFKLILIGILMVVGGSWVRYLLVERTLKSGIEEVVHSPNRCHRC